MEVINEILRLSQENQRFLRLISEKQDHLVERLQEFEGRIRLMRVKDDSPPPSDTETLKTVTNEKVNTKSLSFTDSDEDEDDFKDASQTLPFLEVQKEKVEKIYYPCTLYYKYENGKTEMIGSVTCTFVKDTYGVVLDITNDVIDIDLQVICGVKDGEMYGIKVKDNYSVVVIKKKALAYVKSEVRHVLLMFTDKLAASDFFKQLLLD